jgi:hypothetical protein
MRLVDGGCFVDRRAAQLRQEYGYIQTSFDAFKRQEQAELAQVFAVYP